MRDEPVDEPAVIYPDRDVPAKLLRTAGTVIRRWTDYASTDAVWAPLPCHNTQYVRMEIDSTGQVVICRTCSLTYLLDIQDQNDGGHGAVYTVAEAQYSLSRARRPAR